MDHRDHDEAAFWDERTRSFTEGIADERLFVGPDLTDRTIDGLAYLGIPKLNRDCLKRLGSLQGKRVLDCGCGTGTLAVGLGKQEARVEATDLSLDSLRVARKRASINEVDRNIRFACMRMEQLAWHEASFDGIVGALVIHHIESTGRENPLGWSKIRLLNRTLEGKAALQVTYPEFILFRMLPQYLRSFRSRVLMSLCKGLDESIGRWLPPLRFLGYYQLIELTKRRDESLDTPPSPP
jgi:2-polyprenyl-3-methyl-5-hydroxy-6-metoxy-1,4-benzoquinol methylase